MKQLLDWQGITRQGAHKGINGLLREQRDRHVTIQLACQVRKDHRQMGCRDIYYAMLHQMPRGRDWTEQVLLDSGFRVKKPTRSFTQPGDHICSNLIEGMAITGPNQVWQTDITYVWAGGRWYYVSFVIDVYTRQILACHCSRDLSAASQLECLKKAIASQKGQDLSKLIVHTDRGTQYASEVYRKYLKNHNFRHSMAHYAWQNAYCERVNRTIKRNYLDHYTTNSYRSLSSAVVKAVSLYNRSKPHRGLPLRLSPEQYIYECSQGKHGGYRVKIWSQLTSTKMLHFN